MQSVHKPVLLKEILGYASEAFKKHKEDFCLLDGTLGGAGHSTAIIKDCKGKLTLIGLDRDPEAIKRADNIAGKVSKLILKCENFANMDQVLKQNNIEAIDFLLLDLGISSDELETANRGMSFEREEPLLMTMGEPKSYLFTARDIVNNWEESVLANIIYGYGEEKFAYRIARAIVNYRAKKKIETSTELAEIVKMAVPSFYRHGKRHPATKTFQAIRIVVNDELNSLRVGLDKGYKALRQGGTMAVIAFHSLEDRIVKEFYKDKSQQSEIVTKKPIVPSEEEILINPRARSAKLRILIK